MARTRNERNHNDWEKAIRKFKIDLSNNPFWPFPRYDNLHQYSKNKIHCSCPLCSNKTNNKGKNSSRWNKIYNPPKHDIKQLDDMEEQLKEEGLD